MHNEFEYILVNLIFGSKRVFSKIEVCAGKHL